MPDTMADRFYREAESSFRKIAQESGLGLGIKGTHTTATYGAVPAMTIFGWCGEMAVAVILGLPDEWRPILRGYLLWCAGPGIAGVEPSRLPPVLGECVVAGPDDAERCVRNGLRWLRTHSLEEAQARFASECLEIGPSRGAS